MKNDFTHDPEEFMYLRPQPANKKFSVAIWNKGVLPTCRKLIKLRKVNRLSAGFDDGKGKEYHITVWTDRGYDYGAVFTVRPLANDVTWTGRDLKDNTFFQGDGWDSLLSTVETAVRVDPQLLEHVR
jgi:hypothetical protein